MQKMTNTETPDRYARSAPGREPRGEQGMTGSNRLETHYNCKYAAAGQMEVAPVAISGAPADRFQMTVSVALRNAGGKYLEIGAGSGNTLLSLADHYDELVATELSMKRAQAMNRLFESCSGKIKIVCGNIETERLDYPDGYFDTIVMNAVIEHLVDPISGLREIHRLLRTGGRLIIDTPNCAKWTRRIKLLFGYFPSTASLQEGLVCYDGRTPTDLHDEGHLHYFTYRSLARLCRERAGYSRVERFGYGRTFLSRIWPALFSSDVFVVAYK